MAFIWTAVLHNPVYLLLWLVTPGIVKCGDPGCFLISLTGSISDKINGGDIYPKTHCSPIYPGYWGVKAQSLLVPSQVILERPLPSLILKLTTGIKKISRGPSSGKSIILRDSFWLMWTRTTFKIRWESLRSLERREVEENSSCRAQMTQSRKRKWLWFSLTSLPSPMIFHFEVCKNWFSLRSGLVIW